MTVSVGIHGAAGAVGAVTAFALAQGGEVRLVLADAAEARLACLALDLEMLRAQLPRLDVVVGGVDALAACDVVVACASVPHRDGAPRSAFFEENMAILAPLADALARPEAACSTMVVVSNPVDALATWLTQRLGTRTRVVGHTLNDTLRLRVAIARVRGCDPAEVEAWSIGEHGPGAVPLLSRVHVRGVPVVLSSSECERVREEVGGWYAGWQAHGTGTTSAWSSGRGAAALVRALLEGDPRPWSVSIPLRGEHGVDGVCLTVPALLAPGTAPRPLVWQLDEHEQIALVAAAAAVEQVACAEH